MIKFYGRIVNGVKMPYRPTQYNEYLKSIEGEYEEIVQRKTEEVSKDQRAYFRASIKWLIDNTEQFGGWDESELYECILKELTSYKKDVEWNGVIVEKEFYKRTSDMNKKEMSKLIDDFINWLALDNIFIPSPQEAIIGKYATKQITSANRTKGIKLIMSEEQSNDLQQEF